MIWVDDLDPKGHCLSCGATGTLVLTVVTKQFEEYPQGTEAAELCEKCLATEAAAAGSTVSSMFAEIIKKHRAGLREHRRRV